MIGLFRFDATKLCGEATCFSIGYAGDAGQVIDRVGEEDGNIGETNRGQSSAGVTGCEGPSWSIGCEEDRVVNGEGEEVAGWESREAEEFSEDIGHCWTLGSSTRTHQTIADALMYYAT